MNFIEAFAAMAQGHKVCQRQWSDAGYWYLNHEGALRRHITLDSDEAGNVEPDLTLYGRRRFDGTDWEIFDEAKSQVMERILRAEKELVKAREELAALK